jgi:hypothetical protein
MGLKAFGMRGTRRDPPLDGDPADRVDALTADETVENARRLLVVSGKEERAIRLAERWVLAVLRGALRAARLVSTIAEGARFVCDPEAPNLPRRQAPPRPCQQPRAGPWCRVQAGRAPINTDHVKELRRDACRLSEQAGLRGPLDAEEY